jgi:hypothetical protein
MHLNENVNLNFYKFNLQLWIKYLDKCLWISICSLAPGPGNNRNASISPPYSCEYNPNIDGKNKLLLLIIIFEVLHKISD